MSILKKLRERDEPLNVSELSELLNVAQTTVQRWARLKQIPCIRIGDVIRFDGTLLADWIELEGACACPPRAPSSPEDYLHWEDMGELVRREPVIGQQKEKE